MQFYAPSPAPQHATAKRELEILWVRFIKLQRMRQEILADLDVDAAPAMPCHALPVPQTEHSVRELDDAVFAPIANELRRLAYRAAKIAATSPEDLEYKAVMLAEFLGPGDDSVQTILATSLVMDIRHGHQHPQSDQQDAIFGGHAHAHW